MMQPSWPCCQEGSPHSLPSGANPGVSDATGYGSRPLARRNYYPLAESELR